MKELPIEKEASSTRKAARQNSVNGQEPNASYWASIAVPIQPVTQLELAPVPEKCLARIQEILTAHGMRLEQRDGSHLVTFPDGTTRQEILPRPNFSVRNRIKLPDGYEIREIVPRNSPYGYLGFLDSGSIRGCGQLVKPRSRCIGV